MSNKIEESAGYYELLAGKHETTGRGPNQARVYRELATLVRQCSTYEEIQQRMKAGGYNESPGQALVLDKLLAHRDAATQVGFHQLAAVYQRRHDAVLADPNAAWTTGWESEATGELNRIGNVVDALNDLMSGYFEYRCAPFMTASEPLEKIRDAVNRMQANGESFEAVVANPYYRLHSVFADDKYQAALVTIRGLLAANPDHTAARADYEARYKAMVDGGDQKALAAKKKAYEARQRRSVNLCVAPDDAPGKYTYEPFFEGEL
jgi:hypothetical protein